MLTASRDLHGNVLHAKDGIIGKVDEILFDDEKWTVRYLVVDTGSWLLGRKVLITPGALGELDRGQRILGVNLTCAQVKGSPGVETDEPVSRQWETEYYDYYALPYYWGSMGVIGAPWYQGSLLGTAEPEPNTPEPPRADAHLRSTKEVTGYGIIALDGLLGHVYDFIVDDKTWEIRYLAMDTRDFWPDKKFLLASSWIGQPSWTERTVTVNVTHDQVRNGPEWDPIAPISRTYEAELAEHYAAQNVVAPARKAEHELRQRQLT